MAKPARRRIAVALSGGLDSAYTAYLLKRQGHQLIGLTLLLSQEDRGDEGVTFSRCCAPGEVAAARQLAAQLAMPHYVLDVREHFSREVIDYFYGAYVAGRTPNPCIVCNEKIKFGLLLRRARELGADALATGHYARKEIVGDRCLLLRGIDREKEQSYFLFRLSQAQLRYALWPLGAMRKSEVRAGAAAAGLAVPERESQEVCFVPESESYVEYLRRRGYDGKPGKIVDRSGRVLGEHGGLAGYTIGQRRGIGIAAPEPLYVVALRQEDNALVVGLDSETYCGMMRVTGLNAIAQAQWPDEFTATVKYRYQTRAAAAVIRRTAPDRVEVIFAEPQRGLTPGQAAVFYTADVVMGGGWIEDVS